VDKITFIIADDHPTFRDGLSRLLEDEEGLVCVAKSADGIEAVELVKQLQPDVAIIDVSMPNLNGIEAVKQIKAACPKTAVLMVSAFDYQSYILASLQAGAVGYMSKSASLHEIANAIRLVHSGDSVFDAKATEKVVRHLSAGEGSNKTHLGNLQTRELEVLKLAAKGMSNKEIAGELFISERTVQTHLVNIFRKLGVSSRTQAVLHALREGWLTIDNINNLS